jgi:hypothetical protein
MYWFVSRGVQEYSMILFTHKNFSVRIYTLKRLAMKDLYSANMYGTNKRKGIIAGRMIYETNIMP